MGEVKRIEILPLVAREGTMRQVVFFILIPPLRDNCLTISGLHPGSDFYQSKPRSQCLLNNNYH